MVQAPLQAPQKFTAQQWLMLIGCGVGFAITGADPAIFSANIADIRTDLSLSGSQTAFNASLATLMLAATILRTGVLGDILGKKKMFITGVLITAAGEVMVAAAPDFIFMMLARTVVGVGFAFLLGLSLTIVNSSFPPEQRPLAIGVVGGAVFNFFNGGFTLLVSYYLVVVQGRSAAIVGLLFIPAALLQAFAANWAGRSITVRGNRATMMIGLSVLALTALLFAALGVDSPLWLVVVAFIAMSVGNALSQTPEANLMMSFAPRKLGGSIAGVKSGLGQTFYSLGPVIFTLVGTLFLRGLATDDLEAAGYTADDVRQAMAASQGTSTSPSAGGATVLDPDQAAAVTEAIREPFAQALQLTSLVMLVVPVVALILVHWLLPKRLPGVDEAAPETSPEPHGPGAEAAHPTEASARNNAATKAGAPGTAADGSDS